MQRRAERRTPGSLLSALALAALLAGCSSMYWDRRDSIAFHAGDAVAANRLAQTIDPWPAAAANQRIEANGERMQRAIERYRTNRTTPLATQNTSSIQYQPAPAGPAAGGASQ